VISQVFIDGGEVEFEQHNFTQEVVPQNEFDHSLSCFQQYYRAAQMVADEGELVIRIPKKIRGT
jgi:hypothetical protein